MDRVRSIRTGYAACSGEVAIFFAGDAAYYSEAELLGRWADGHWCKMIFDCPV